MPEPLHTFEIDMESPEYAKAFDAINETVGKLLDGGELNRNAVAALLGVIADYCVPPGDVHAAARFVTIATWAATSARDGEVT